MHAPSLLWQALSRREFCTFRAKGVIGQRGGAAVKFVPIAATSSGKEDGLASRSGGLCLYNNMKLKFEVLYDEGSCGEKSPRDLFVLCVRDLSSVEERQNEDRMGNAGTGKNKRGKLRVLQAILAPIHRTTVTT